MVTVDTSLAVVQLLKLIALLFPVVALLLQLQHRAANSIRLKILGLSTGIGLLALLSISFLQLSIYLISTQSLPSLLVLPLLAMALISLMLPFLIVLSSERIANETERMLSTAFDKASSVRPRGQSNRTTEKTSSDEE